MKRIGARIYAVTLMLAWLAGTLFVGLYAWNIGVIEGVTAFIGVFLSLVFAPILHELGHVIFARVNKFACMLVKCFCVRYARGEKRRWRLVSPFAPDQTQVIPQTSGDMKRRAKAYTAGGLVVQGSALVALIIVTLLLVYLGKSAHLFFGMIPYMVYLFLLNAVPVSYFGGKTDAAVYRGLKRNHDEEQVMLAAMEIQGRLYEGQSFAEIDEALYINVPQLAEDEPLYGIILDLQYRFYLEKGDLEKAADKLNRLAQSQAYLSDEEVEKIAAELVYMHTQNSDFARANECAALCERYLQSDVLTAKRVLAAYCAAQGKAEETQALLKQAERLISTEEIVGKAKAEAILLKRIII